MQDAAEHAYFMGSYKSRIDGSEHATLKEVMAYDAEIHRASADAGHVDIEKEMRLEEKNRKNRKVATRCGKISDD
jgi:hypothetical protein